MTFRTGIPGGLDITAPSLSGSDTVLENTVLVLWRLQDNRNKLLVLVLTLKKKS